MPDIAVPSQYASTSSLSTPADPNASSRGVDQQVVGALVPVLAERRAPHADDRDAILDAVRSHVRLSVSQPRTGPRLPEVVVDLVGGEQLPERHLDPVAHLDVAGVDVGELDRQAAAAVEVDDRERDRRARRVRDAVDGEQRDRALDVGHRRRLHVVDGVAASDARRVAGAGRRVPRSREPTNAYFHSSFRPDTDAEMRSGSGRRGGSTVTTLRHDRNLPYPIGAPFSIWVFTARAGAYPAIASVVRNSKTSTPSARTTRPMI